MVSLSKLRKRFFGDKVEFYADDETLALAMQLGWVEKYLGAYMLTDRGAEEILAMRKKNKK